MQPSNPAPLDIDLAEHQRSYPRPYPSVREVPPIPPRPPTASGLPASDQDIVVQLCRMPVDLAAPLLNAHIASLTPQALLAIIALTGEAHQTIIANRQTLDVRVIDALLKCSSDRVLMALAGNPALNSEQRAQLHRLAQDRPVLATELATADERISHSNLKLLTLLRAGEADGFITEAAKRLNLAPAQLEATLATPSLVPFALLICALDIDRAVFFDLAAQWQSLHNHSTAINTTYRPLLLSVFTLDPSAAAQKLAAG